MAKVLGLGRNRNAAPSGVAQIGVQQPVYDEPATSNSPAEAAND